MKFVSRFWRGAGPTKARTAIATGNNAHRGGSRPCRAGPIAALAAGALAACTIGEPPIDGAYRVVSETPPGAGGERVQVIETRPGVTTRFLLARPYVPMASVILFAGGHGRLGLDLSGRMQWGRGNFLVRSRRLFVGEGVAMATVDAPSDRQGPNGLLFGFRGSPEHAQDIAAIVRYLRDRFGRPVWLVGTSRGSASAANGGLRLPDSGPAAPDGIVLTSTLTVANARGLNVLDMELAAIRAPVVIAHHRKDECHVTPFDGARTLRRALRSAPEVALLAYDGGRAEGTPCQAKSFHGFLGIEERVVTDIANRIKGTRPAR